jgi:hypothetical protein
VRRITVLAQDPDVLDDGRALTTQVMLAADPIFTGPRGSRIEVVDYDSSTDTFYGPYDLAFPTDPYGEETDVEKLVADPRFHALNAYAITASTLFEFERALGRHLSWGFGYGTHQIKVFPHAFSEPNAFYSQRDECLAFGYFPDGRNRDRTVFTCLSHDIVAHEATHAILDGLRDQLMRPSSPDQAAFHEGFADVVALLMVLKNEELVGVALKSRLSLSSTGLVSVADAMGAIRSGEFLTGLAEEMGRALVGMGRDALRRSLRLTPDPSYYTGDDFNEPHDRGEILVAAVMHGFLRVWEKRLDGKLKKEGVPSLEVASWRVREEGARAAQHLLRIVIRAIDYLPPVHVHFGDFLSAMLTADWELCPDDSLYGYRDVLVESFKAYGIAPASGKAYGPPGVWAHGAKGEEIVYAAADLDSLKWNKEAVFRLLWDNYEVLGLERDIFTRISSVRPVWRIGPSGFILRETVAEYYQLFKRATKADLQALDIEPPAYMTDSTQVDLVGGGTLIFDEFGRLKYHIHNNIRSSHQGGRLTSLWQRRDSSKTAARRRFSDLHRRRGSASRTYRAEGWE